MQSEYPREKLKRLGPRLMEDHELLSVILSSGNRKESVFDISKRVMTGFDREEIKTEKNIESMQAKYQIGNVHATRIMAAVELGKRLFDTPISNRQIKGYDDIYQILKNMQYLKKEHVKGIYLNTRNFIIREETISIGSLDANIIHPREIFKPAIEYSAYAIIVAHNHPSGDPAPSRSDIQVTKHLQNIGNLLQIPLIDHIIIGNNNYYSFSSAGLLDPEPNH